MAPRPGLGTRRVHGTIVKLTTFEQADPFGTIVLRTCAWNVDVLSMIADKFGIIR